MGSILSNIPDLTTPTPSGLPGLNPVDPAGGTSRSSNSTGVVTVLIIGIDIGKDLFHIVGLDDRGAMVLRQKWSRPRWRSGLPMSHVPDRHGNLRWGASSQPKEAIVSFGSFLARVWKTISACIGRSERRHVWLEYCDCLNEAKSAYIVVRAALELSEELDGSPESGIGIAYPA